MLTEQEIDILIEALDAWEGRDFTTAVADTIFTSLLPEGEVRDNFVEEREARKEERDLKRKSDAEKSILIKAKLIQMKDQLSLVVM